MGELKRLLRAGSGSEARTARSLYGLRLVLSATALPVTAAAAAWFLWRAGDGPWAPAGMVVAGAICVAVALFAAIDIVVILRNRPRGGP